MNWRKSRETLEEWCDKRNGSYNESTWTRNPVSGPRASCRLSGFRLSITGDQDKINMTSLSVSSYNDDLKFGNFTSQVQETGGISIRGDTLTFTKNNNSDPVVFR